MVLSSHSTPASRLGNRREVNITVRKSDDPFGVIEFIQPGLDFTINESKALDVYSGTHIFKLHLNFFNRVKITSHNFICDSILPHWKKQG